MRDDFANRVNEIKKLQRQIDFRTRIESNIEMLISQGEDRAAFKLMEILEKEKNCYGAE